MAPRNWEAYAQLPADGKPDTQQVIRSFQEAVWGGVPDDPTVTTFSMQPSPVQPKTFGVAIAPYSYWQRGLDMYTLVQQTVDQAIGDVVAAIPRSQLANTVIVFASDHGEYAGAHGLLSGKLGKAYEEAIHLPLIVADLTHRFAIRVDKPRRQLASSVDLMPMLVPLGNRGSIAWRRGQLARIYDERLNLVQLLRNPNAAGQDHILFATDEVLLDVLNYLHAPTHVLVVRTPRRSSSPTPTGSRARPVRCRDRCSLSSTTTPPRRDGPRPEATPTNRARRRWRTSCSTSTCPSR